MATDFNEQARRLRNAVEPVAAGAYFAPEAHAAYAALGFAAIPVTRDGVARPDLKACPGDQDPVSVREVGVAKGS